MVVLRIAAVLLVLAMPLTALADSKKPVRIALTGSTAQAVTAHIAGAALRMTGYKFEFVEMAADDVLDALLAGEVHIQPEWPADDTSVEAWLEMGAVRDLGRRNNDELPPNVRKIISRSMERPWPGAVKLFSNFRYPNADQEAMVAAISNGAQIEVVVKSWLKANRARIGKWKSVAVNWMKP